MHSKKWFRLILIINFVKANHKETLEVISTAIDAGYRHFDCALIYGTEPAVGEAIQRKLADGTLKSRQELFITAKACSLYQLYHTITITIP